MLGWIIYKGKSVLTHQHPSQPSCSKPKSLTLLQLICPTVIEEQCEVCWWSFLYNIQDNKPIVQERECWLVSEPGELSLCKLFENTSGCEQAHVVEAVRNRVGFRPFLLFLIIPKKAVINSSGRKKQESGTWNAIIVTPCSTQSVPVTNNRPGAVFLPSMCFKNWPEITQFVSTYAEDIRASETRRRSVHISLTLSASGTSQGGLRGLLPAIVPSLSYFCSAGHRFPAFSGEKIAFPRNPCRVG